MSLCLCVVKQVSSVYIKEFLYINYISKVKKEKLYNFIRIILNLAEDIKGKDIIKETEKSLFNV